MSEIPPKKRLDVLIEIFRHKVKANGYKLRFLTQTLYITISNDEQKTMMSIISENLKTTNAELEIRYILQILPVGCWYSIDEVAQMRIENIIIKSISEGQVFADTTIAGSLATWANGFLQHFTLIEKVVETIIGKLNDEKELEYLFEYFFYKIPDIINIPSSKTLFIRKLSNFIADQNTSQDWRNRLQNKLELYPKEWKEEFNAYLNQKEAKNEDGTPYTLDTTDWIHSDDIPF